MYKEFGGFGKNILHKNILYLIMNRLSFHKENTKKKKKVIESTFLPHQEKLNRFFFFFLIE